MNDVPRETSDKLHRFAALLIAANQHQNLIGKSTIETLWQRHFDDAAQLVEYDARGVTWLDIGSGAGLPGIVIAILTQSPIVLVEPRRLRADFLRQAVEELDLVGQVSVMQAKVERIDHPPVDRITARAVASIDRLFAMASHLSHPETIWVLPKGRGAKSELDEARKTWQGDFRLEPSRTDGDAHILIASSVRRIHRARGVA